MLGPTGTYNSRLLYNPHWEKKQNSLGRPEYRRERMEEEEHEVYGGEIPDVEGDMDAHNTDVDMSAADDDAVKVISKISLSCDQLVD